MEDSVMKKTLLATIFAVAALLLVLCMAGCSTGSSASAPASDQTAEITVSASASVSLVPDKASVYFGVSTQENSPELAQKKNTEAVNRVTAVLTGRGIAEKSIRTTSYNMYPQYIWSDSTGEQRINGYNVVTTMSVQDQDIEKVGELLSACVEAGINQIDSVSFLCSGYDDAYRQAFIQAVEAARSKAEAVAAAEGKKLADVVSISEGWQDTSLRYAKGANSIASISVEEAAMDMAAPILQPGESEISASVTVTYRLK